MKYICYFSNVANVVIGRHFFLKTYLIRTKLKKTVMLLTRIISLLFVYLLLSTSFSLAQDTINNNGIEVGQYVKDFKALDAHGKQFTLSESLKNGPVVLIFYRGHWCPYCNKHLSEFQTHIEEIINLGASVIAVSPEKPENALQMERKTGATFQLLYDEAYLIAKQFNVLFTPDEKTVQKYNKMLNANLEEAHSDGSNRLPVPATFIIDKSAKITWRQFDPNYKNRSTVEEILKVLRQ